MIEQATERRLAGDWEGACRAANVKVEVDLRSVSRLPGSRTRRAVEEDLRHFAPDLLRWHLPRLVERRGTLAPSRAITLAKYGRRRLYVVTPRLVEGPQHLTLRLATMRHPWFESDPRYSLPKREDWRPIRHVWDVRHAAELLERSGGDGSAPFFHSDGTPLAEDALGDPGTGPAGLTERVTLLLDAGEPEAAFDVAGIDLDLTLLGTHSRYPVSPHEILAMFAPTRLVQELELAGGQQWLLRYDWAFAMALDVQGNRPRVRLVKHGLKRPPLLPEPHWRRLPDLDLLRAGHLTPEDLHPLVRSALFPARPPAEGPVGPSDPRLPGPIRVRCGGEWHIVHVQEGGLRAPHTAQEMERESAMRALGGQSGGCFALVHTVETGEGRLPRCLHTQRGECFMRAQHGDTPGVMRMLDQGVSPAYRDSRRRTLLHYLPMLDHTELLPRLLKAGLDIEARDRFGRTPLLNAVAEDGTEELIRALVKAGARIKVSDFKGRSVHDHLNHRGRTDLDWLEKRVAPKPPPDTINPWDYGI